MGGASCLTHGVMRKSQRAGAAPPAPVGSLPDRKRQVSMQVLGPPDHQGELAALLGRGLRVSLLSLACFTQLEA